MPEPRDVQQTGLYTQAGYVNEYEFSTGVCVLPLAEDPPTNPTELKAWSPIAVVQLHAPFRIRRMSFETEKQNNPPVLPTPGDTGAFVFTGGIVAISTVPNTTFANFNWGAKAGFTFVENCVSRPEDGLVLGTVSWPLAPSVQNSTQFAPTPSSALTGAIAQAGADARVGYAMGQQIAPKLTVTVNPFSGNVTDGWGYNQASYLPGCFFSDDMANGGPVSSV